LIDPVARPYAAADGTGNIDIVFASRHGIVISTSLRRHVRNEASEFAKKLSSLSPTGRI
jgi:hypothetical protein